MNVINRNTVSRLMYMTSNNLKNLINVKLPAYKIIKSCTGDQCLYIMDAVQETGLPAAVQFRKHIIQKKHRLILNDFFYQIYF